MGRRDTGPEWDALAKALCFRDEAHMYDVLYNEEKLSIAEIADRLKSGTATINRRMALHKIVRRSRGGPRSTANKRSFLFHLDQRIFLKLSSKVIAARYDISYSVVYHYKLWKFGNDLRTYYKNDKKTEHNSVGLPHG